jgi:hypothetical protein
MKVSKLLLNARLRRLKPKKTPKSGTYLGTEIDGEFFEGTKYKDTMFHVCEWLINRGKLIPEKCPYGNSRRKRYLVNTQPFHIHSDFFCPKRLSNGLFVETHKSIKQIQSDAELLLEIEGFSPYIFKIVEAK